MNNHNNHSHNDGAGPSTTRQHPVKKPKARRSASQSPPGDSSVDLAKVRAYAACRNCRVKKIKCLPSLSSDPLSQPSPCQQCIQTRTECVYPPTRDRAAYSRQYVQNLESRVQALEMVNQRMLPMLAMFERGDPALQSRTSTIADVSVQKAILPVTSTERISMEEEVVEEDGQSSPPIEEDGGQMAQDERGNYRWIGSSNTLSLLDSFSHQQPISGKPQTHDDTSNPYFGPVAGSGVVKALPGVEEVSFPSDKAAAEMIAAFFAEVHLCLPVVAEQRFKEDYDRLMSRRRKGEAWEFGGFISVLFAIFALGERVIVTSRAWHRERAKLQRSDMVDGADSVLPGEAEAGVIWYERAQILHYSTLKDVNIYQVQCLTLLAAFQASVNAMPMSWLLAGQALRVAQDLGLHRSTARLKISFVEKQIRARCWWAIYGLERLVSISLGRPVGVDDLDIDVAYPAEIDDEVLLKLPNDGAITPAEMPAEPHDSTMSGFVALTKLCKIAGRVVHVLYRPSNGRSVSDVTWATAQQNAINKVDKLLREWLSVEVPTKYKDASSSRSVQLVSAVLSNSYFVVLLTLHRNFLPSSPDFPRPRPPPSSQSLAHCVDAARSVIHIAAQQRTLVPPSHHLAVACQYLWSSAVILLLCEVQARDQVVIEAVESHTESCRRSLAALEPVWPGCRKLKELLNEVEARTKDAVARPAARPTKRRKSSAQDGSSNVKRTYMGPPQANASRPVSSASTEQGTPRSLNKAIPTQRVQNGTPRYETSDTRTMLDEQYNMQTYNLPTTTAVFDQQLIPRQQLLPQQSQPQPFDTTFDVGGVTFDGLEMLQGFTGADASSFWSTLTSDHLASLTPGTTNQAPFLVSGQNTPSSQVSGPSPGPWAYANGNGLGMDTTGTGADFWSQVAGGSFDWQADPSVPFNI